MTTNVDPLRLINERLYTQADLDRAKREARVAAFKEAGETLKRWCKCGPRISCSFCAIRRELEAATTKQPTEVKEGDDG